jgi:hypothetical protein
MSKHKGVGLLSGLILLSRTVSASTYLEMLRELNARAFCLLVWVAPLIALFLLVLGGFRLIASEDATSREEGRSMVYNSILGLIIIFSFIFIAAFLGKLDLTRCLPF